jgi:hypothetical protein
MKSRKIHESNGEKTFALVFDNGDEVMEKLLGFLRREGVDTARFTAIGAFSRATLGYFDWVEKQYIKNAVDEQVEVLSLIGDVALSDDEPAIHAHVVLGRSDASTFGGHLLEGHVRPTLELILVESPEHLKKVHDPESGLALIRL